MPKANTKEEARERVKDLERIGEKWYYRKSPWSKGYIIQRRPKRKVKAGIRIKR